MDMTEIKESASIYLKKYRYVIIVLLAGILLMALPEEKDATPAALPDVKEEAPSLEESLAEILSLTQGAGKVEVLLTQAAGEETLYQTDENADADSIRRETVLITNSGRDEMGLVRQINPPVFQGAIILCQGADNAGVRLALVEAVKSVTGLTADRITILKMK